MTKQFHDIFSSKDQQTKARRMQAVHVTSTHAAQQRSHTEPSLHVSRTCTTRWKRFHDMFDPTRMANYYKRRRWSAFIFL